MLDFATMKKLLKDQDGAALFEYASLLAIVLAVTASTLPSIAVEMNRFFTALLTFLQGVP